jgi:cytochrome P450
LTDTSQNDWDPRSPAVLADQRAAYDEMRDRCPVARSELMGWSVFRHADIARVVDDPATFSSASRHIAIPNGMDPPEHARYRDAIAPSFSEERLAALEPRCRAIAAELIEPMLAQDSAELLGEFAEPFALRTLCALLGWPESLWECLGGWTHGNQQAAFSRDPAAGRALAKLITEHVQANLDQHRDADHAPRDVTDALLATAVDGAPLTDEQIVSVLRNWIAGEGTVAGAISLAVLHLAQDVELQRRLRDDPSLIPQAVEELLRVDDPLVANRRTTTRAVEIGGRQVPAGAPISLMWIAANRDPATFENPEVVDIGRDTSDSLVWGRGAHLCLGAPLARLELRVAIEELLARSGAFEVAGEVRQSVYPSDGLAWFGIRIARMGGEQA